MLWRWKTQTFVLLSPHFRPLLSSSSSFAQSDRIFIASRESLPRLSFPGPALGNFLPLLPKFSSLAVDSLEDPQPYGPHDESSLTLRLKSALEQKNPDQAWRALHRLRKLGAGVPDKSLVKDSLALLVSSHGDAISLFRAYKLLLLLKKEDKFDCLDGESLGLLALAFAKAKMYDRSAKALRVLVYKHYYPSLSLWKTVMEHLEQKLEGAAYVRKVFLKICRYLSKKMSSAQGCTVSNALLSSMKPDKEAFYIALRACATLGDFKKAEEMIEHMPRFALSPDNTSFCSLIKAYEKGGDNRPLKKILSRMNQTQVIPNSTTLNSLITAYVSLGEIQAAAQLLLSWNGKGLCSKEGMSTQKRNNEEAGDKVSHKMLEVDELIRGWMIDVGSPCCEICALVLKGFLERGKFANAAAFLAKFYHVEDFEYIPCSLAIEGVLRLGLRDEVNGILQELAAQKTPADKKAYGLLVKAYCKLPQPVKGEAVLHDGRKLGHQLAVDCYDVLIEAYILLQEYDCAALMFRKMKRHGITPILPTFRRLLSFFEKDAKPHVMRKILEAALCDPPLKVEVHHWNRIVQMFCKAKRMVDAKMVVKRMKQLGFDPDAATYICLLSGYILQGEKTNEINLLWVEIKEQLSTQPESTPLRLTEELLNGFLIFFVKYGYFKNALDVISQMEENYFWVDEQKLRGMYKNLRRDLYKHHSQRSNKLEERMKYVEAFKVRIGLPS